MSVSDRRITLRTEQLLETYLQNGTLPDELLVQQQIQAEFAPYLDPTTGAYNINVPLWQPSNITYRQQSSADQWNATQRAAAEDTSIAYAEFLEDLNNLTNGLYDYINRSNLIKNRISDLVSRVQNLLLISSSTDGFLYSFFDTFLDTSKVDFTTEGETTTALVNTATNNVQLPINIENGISGAETSTDIINLLFLQPNDVRFSVLNSVQSQTSISNTQLKDIFTNQATAWQQEITITAAGPLVSELTVKISPLEPVLINKIEIATKMPNYANQILVQVLVSEDGVSYHDIQSANNPQFIGQNAEFNFTPAFASYVKFIITKNTADSGQTYNIGFQYISFQQVTYALTAELFSIPISFPNGRPISKVAIETCSIEPNGTGISYSILRPSGNPIPISNSTDPEPLFPKVINIGSLTDVEEDVFTSQGQFPWAVEPSGRYSINVSGLASPNSVNLLDITIPNTMTLWRNTGGAVAAVPSGVMGWQVNASGLPEGYFQTYMSTSNVGGTEFNIGSNQAFIDRVLTNGAISLENGIHTLASTAYNNLQDIVAENSDIYFAWNLKFTSVFEFYNNFPNTDPTIFTYDPATGKIVINGIQSVSQVPDIDFNASFLASANGDGSFVSSTTALGGTSFSAPPVINAGSSIDITVGTVAKWVNEIQLQVNANTDTIISVLGSVDNVNFFTIFEDQIGPIAGTTSFGAIRFDTPVYARYLRIYFVQGSNLNMAGGFVSLFAPIFLNAGVVQTEPFYLPTASVWDEIVDSTHNNASQTYEIYSGFSNSLIQEYSTTSWVSDISGVYVPKLYLRIKSNNALDPYIFAVKFNSDPLPNEGTRVKFSFLAPGNINTTNAIKFNAHLSSTIQGVTPQLQNYRVKLL